MKNKIISIAIVFLLFSCESTKGNWTSEEKENATEAIEQSIKTVGEEPAKYDDIIECTVKRLEIYYENFEEVEFDKEGFFKIFEQCLGKYLNNDEKKMCLFYDGENEDKSENGINNINLTTKRIEDMDTEGSENAFLGIEYEPGLPLNKKQLLQSLIGGDDDGNMWVIDPKDNNIKYALGDNPNYNGQVGQSSTRWKDGNKLRSLSDLANVIGKKLNESKTINNFEKINRLYLK
jgi:hypothetical protein